MKQVGYRRFHPAIFSFFKGPNGNFPQRLPPAHVPMILGQLTKAEKKWQGEKKKKREGRVGLYPNKNLLSEISLHFKMFENETIWQLRMFLNQLLRGPFPLKKNRTKQF